MELIFSLKLKLPITELNRSKNYAFLNLLIFIMKKTVIINGAMLKIKIVKIANSDCYMFSLVLQSSPTLKSVMDYNVRVR